MLKRLYVHNYKCLVNFEINFDKDISLFLGPNGSGKSTVFEVLDKLRRVVVGEEKVENVFDYKDSPRGVVTPERYTHFELDFSTEGLALSYKYKLTITLGWFGETISIKEESLHFGDILIIESKDGDVFFESRQPPISLGVSRSCISRSAYGGECQEFLKSLDSDSLFIARINPYGMVSTFNKASAEIETDFSNFSEWFAHQNEKNRRGVSVFEATMRDILPGYEYFKIDPAGQAKVLIFDFENAANKKYPFSYVIEELSEGQKTLIALYALIYCAPENSLICIDEPENFLALPEIQPWLNELRDRCKERNLQALLISHHPSLINFLASDSGYWFSRQDNHTRIEKITKQEGDGLSLAQLIEMGWIYGD